MVCWKGREYDALLHDASFGSFGRQWFHGSFWLIESTYRGSRLRGVRGVDARSSFGSVQVSRLRPKILHPSRSRPSHPSTIVSKTSACLASPVATSLPVDGQVDGLPVLGLAALADHHVPQDVKALKPAAVCLLQVCCSLPS